MPIFRGTPRYKVPQARLPGPPTFSFNGGSSFTGNSTTTTLTGVGIGTASDTRFIACLVAATGSTVGVTPSTAVFTGSISGIIYPVFNVTGGVQAFLVTASIPTTTSTSLVITWSGTQTGTSKCYAYNTNITTLASTIPVIASTTVTSGTTESAQIPITKTGSSLLFIYSGSGVTSQSITASDAAVTTDETFNVLMAGSKNNAPVSTSSNVTASWTGSATAAGLGLVTFR